jgi:aldose 1-epimerase
MSPLWRLLVFVSLVLIVPSSIQARAQKGSPEVTESVFGTMPDGRTISMFTLRNANGLEACITNFGGALVSLMVPDRMGNFEDVVLGYDSLSQYLVNKPYLGVLVGRYANRISGGRFTLDGNAFELARNNDANHLHGGVMGLSRVLWNAKTEMRKEGPALVLSYVSPDGEDGYPGTLSLSVVYLLTNRDELTIDYTANTDKATIINLTNHSYFNLTGAGTGSILMHDLEIAASRFTPIDDRLIPTGELRAVAGTPMDFRRLTLIGARIDAEDDQIVRARGYDHNWVLDKNEGEYSLAARLYDGRSGRLMEVYTSEPGLQFYSGNFLDGTDLGKGGTSYRYRFGVCLETQHFPDSPNHPEFPSTVLRPGEQYRSRTSYRFLVR